MSTESGSSYAAAFDNVKTVIESETNINKRESDTVYITSLMHSNHVESNINNSLESLPSFDSVKLDFIESSLNYQGNYQNYVYKVMQSISNFKKLDFNKHIQMLAQELPDTNRKTLILDLDETLIHADFDGKFKNHDHIVTFKYDDEEISVPIFIRPELSSFLETVNELFEIVVFTAGKKEYADAVLNFLDPENKFFKFRFYRENCINIKNKVFIKDLRIFSNRKLENIIVLDNSMYSFTNQLSNGILINSFYHDKSDKELSNALAYLVNYLHKTSDIRSINDQIFNFSSILEQLSQKDKLKCREI